jgi:cobalt-zinc-cadmium efflux system protein
MAHDHNHPDQLNLTDSNRNAFIIGICLNLAFVLAEVICGIIYNSMGLLTDAGHNASDVASLALSLIAFGMAKKKSTPKFTYGFKKTTVLAAFANAVVLLIAIGILGYESMQRLFKPQTVEGGVIAWVAGVGILVNSISAWLFFRNRKKDLNIKAAYLHLLTDALVSFGVVAAGIVIAYTHWYLLDPAIGLVIMVVILASTWGLLGDSFKMTIDAVPSGIELSEIKRIIAGMPHVKQVHHVHVWPLSTTENALTAHVVVETKLSFEEKLQTIENIKHELEHYNIQHSTIELSQ